MSPKSNRDLSSDDDKSNLADSSPISIADDSDLEDMNKLEESLIEI